MKSNVELIREAKNDLKVSLGQTDWMILMNTEGRDIKLGRSPFLLTHHIKTKRWTARILGLNIETDQWPSASEAYIQLRLLVQKISELKLQI
ncbi:hypothetical protein GZOEXZXM_CDS0115 [Salmonella phage SeKF_64]|nr:hypothetical protein PS5_41 [Salmonella phage PS5]